MFRVNRAELDVAAAKLTPPPAAAAEAPWLTAEAVPVGPARPARDEGPEAAAPLTPPAATNRVVSTEGTSSRRRPRRRRWLPPTSPAERDLDQVEEPPALFRCPACGRRHQPFPMHAGGASNAYSRPLDPADDPHTTRPRPLGRGPADTTSLVRDAFRPWQARSASRLLPGPVGVWGRLARWWGVDETTRRQVHE